MAYGVHYTLPFKTLAGVDCHFDILEKDYTGSIINMIGAGSSPVVHSWDGSDILDPIRGSKCVVQYVTQRNAPLPIESFLTNDETKYRGDFYMGGQLQFTGFMVIDDFQAPYLYAPIEQTLTFTDGLALLNNVTLADAGYYVTSGKRPVSELFYAILLQTNLNLFCQAYYNLFPFGDTNRITTPQINPFSLQYISIKSFLVNDDEFENCKQVLEKILKANCCVLMQQKGVWVIVRQPEYKRFSRDIPGGDGLDIAPALGQIAIAKNGQLIPIERAQVKAYTRPTKVVTNTFNYRIPQLLTNSNLQRLGDVMQATTDGDNTLTDYELRDWTNQHDQDAFIRVITNTDTGNEIDRFIVMPFRANKSGASVPVVPIDGLVAVEIEVNAGDRCDFSFRFKGSGSSVKNRDTSFAMYLQNATEKYMLYNSTTGLSSETRLLNWKPVTFANDNIPASVGSFYVLKDTITEWQTVDLFTKDYNKLGMERFPIDGVFTIVLYGLNSLDPTINIIDCYVKDFKFDYYLYINDTIQIIGQENKASQAIVTKNEKAEEIFIDNSPRFNIAGGIFKQVGGVPALTFHWIKASGEVGLYRHGQVNAIDQLLLESNYRTVFEGPFKGLCNPTDSLTIEGLEGIFVPYRLTLDYRQNSCTLTAMEVSKDSDPSFDSLAYQFKYLYK